MPESSLVKVSVPLEASEAFRGQFTEELLWTAALGNEQYRIENVPLYTERVNYHDVIEVAATSTKYPVFKRLVEKSPYTRFSVFMEDCSKDERSSFLEIMREFDCIVESDSKTGIDGVAVPQANHHTVELILEESRNDGFIVFDRVR